MILELSQSVAILLCLLRATKKGYGQHDLPSCGSVRCVLMRWGFMYSQFNLSIHVQCTDLW